MITLLHPYYDHREMMTMQLSYWAKWTKNVKKHIEIIVVDDGSQQLPFRPKDYSIPSKLNLKVYRIKENIPWNVGGVKNLGFAEATNPWVIAADMDLVLESSEARKIIELDLRDRKNRHIVYWPHRHRISSKRKIERKSRPHCNSFIMNRSFFWEIGGFDEDFSGNWGFEDDHFHTISERVHGAQRVELPEIFFLDKFQDIGRTPTAKERPGHGNNKRRCHRKFEKLDAGKTNYHSGNPLRFEWERVL